MRRYPEAEREEHKYEVQKIEEDAMTDEDAPVIDPTLIGAPPAGEGKWASCVRLYDVYKNQTLQLIELEDNEAAVSMCTCVFHEKVNTGENKTKRRGGEREGERCVTCIKTGHCSSWSWRIMRPR